MWSTVAVSWSLLTHRQKIGLSILTFLRTFAGGLDLLAIALVAVLVATLTGNNLPFPVLEDFVSSSSDPVPLFLVIAAVVFLFKTVLGISLSRVTFRFLAKVETNASMKIVRSIFGNDLARLKNYARSELDWSISRSTGVLFGSILGQASTLLAEGTVAWLILFVFFIADWFSAGVVIVYFGSVLLIFQLLTRGVLGKSGKAVSAGSITISQAILDFFATFREINVSGRQAFFYQRIYESRSSLAMGQARSNYMGAVPRLVVEFALIAGAIGFFALENWRSNGNPDYLLISVFVIGSLRIMSALLPIQRAIMSMQFLGPQASLARELLEEALPEPLPVRVGPPQDTKYLGLGLHLEITGATFRYGDAQEAPAALDQISMKVDSGSFVALIGPSGSGKSTLVDLVLGLHSPASGEVLYDGLPTNVYKKAFPATVGYVPQKPGLIFGNIRDNVALGLPPDQVDDRLVWEALDRAEVGNFVRELPNGIDSHIGKNLDSLSGGQLQRLGLARALYLEPRLLVLDEATSALDAETEHSISTTLSTLRESTTLLVVAHRLSTIQHADCVYLLDQGRLVASGDFAQLLVKSELVKKYVTLMSFED